MSTLSGFIDRMTSRQSPWMMLMVGMVDVGGVVMAIVRLGVLR